MGLRSSSNVPISVNLLTHFFEVFSLEGRPTDDEGVEDDTD